MWATYYGIYGPNSMVVLLSYAYLDYLGIHHYVKIFIFF